MARKTSSKSGRRTSSGNRRNDYRRYEEPYNRRERYYEDPYDYDVYGRRDRRDYEYRDRRGYEYGDRRERTSRQYNDRYDRRYNGSYRKKPYRPKKKKLNKKRFFLFIAILLLIGFFVVKGVVAVKNRLMPPPPKPKAQQEVKKTPEEIQAEENKKITVVIDAAKGGKDSGNKLEGSDYSEKDINLEIAKDVYNTLKKDKHLKVFMTRESDEDMISKDRADFARNKSADLLISIGMNSSTVPVANGVDTYYSTPKQQPSLVADEENEESLNDTDKSSSSNSKTLKDDKNTKKNADSNKNTNSDDAKSKTLDEKLKEEEKAKNDSSKEIMNLSKSLAESIQKTTLSFVNMSDRGSRQGDVGILKYAHMPAVIIHCGFITNQSDVEKLSNIKTRSEFADGISQGILQFIEKNENTLINQRLNYR